MKRTSYVLLSLILTAFLGGLIIWNFSATGVSAQKSDDFGENPGVITEYNARDEFALTQGGANGLWNYGYSTSDADNTLNLFSVGPDTDTVPIGCSSPFERWRIANAETIPQISRLNPAVTCANIPSNALFIHPGKNDQRAVLRFNAPTSGTFQITGTFQKQAANATSDLKIIKNAALPGETVLYTGAIGAVYQQSFNFTVAIAAGDKIDFSVGDDGSNTWQGDGSSIAVTIGQPITACSLAPANLLVNIPAENSPSDVRSINPNASLVGDTAYTNTGKVSRAFEFDGSGDYVRVEDNAAQRPATALTAEGWFKLDSASGIVSLISKPVRGSALNSYTLYVENGQLRGLIGNPSQYTRALSSFTPQAGVWHHLAFTYDFTGGVSTLKIYANGVDVTSGVDGTANLPLYYDANPFPLLIGGEFESNAPTFFLDGQADEVSIYGRALSQTEIFEIVQQGSFGKCPNVSCAQTPNNLVSWFAGEQNALDSRSNNHGILFNGATFQTGKVGQGFKFDGANDYVEIPDSPSLKPQTLTVETWVKFDSLASTTTGGAPAGYQNIIFKKNSRAAGTGFEGGYSLVKNPDNRIGFGFNSAGGGTNSADSTTVAQAGVWYHIVATHDGANIRLYVNGQLEGTGTATFPIDYGTTPLYLGSSEVPFNGYFNGVLDEPSIYNRALTATEISSIYNADSSGKCKPTGLNPAANQIAWFSGDGDTRDLTGLNSNGTLQGNTDFRVGKVGQAFGFDGNGDIITTADSPNWDFGTGDFAVEGWFNAPNPTDVQRIISAGSQADGANNLWTFGYGDIPVWGGGQRLNFAVFNGGGYSDFSSNQVAFRPNTWHHAAIVRSGSTFTFYLDGVPVGTVAVGAGFAVNGGSTGAILGARYNNNPSLVFEFANGMLDEVSVYKRAVTGSEISAIYNAGVAGKLKSAATPVNFVRNAKTVSTLAPTTVQLSSATVTFAQVTSAGTTSQSGADLGLLPQLPSSFTTNNLNYDLSTTADYSGNVTVCFNVPAIPAGNFAETNILHLENGGWESAAANTVTRNYPQICGDFSSLSPFAVVQGLAPSAAGVSLSGRAVAGKGRGVANALIQLTDQNGNIRAARTNHFGFYRFLDIEAGQTYVVNAYAKHFQFQPQVVFVNNEMTLDLTAIE